MVINIIISYLDEETSAEWNKKRVDTTVGKGHRQTYVIKSIQNFVNKKLFKVVYE